MTHPKIVSTPYPVNELITHRWSPRAFAPTPLTEEQILSMVEAARWAPSSQNIQPWSFVVATPADTDTFSKLIQCLGGGNLEWAPKVPLLILAVAHLIHPRTGQHNDYAWYDLGLAVQSMVFQAHTLGIYAHQMGGFDKQKAQELLEIPEGYQPVALTAFGYLGDPAVLPERYQPAETAPRVRKPLAEFVFTGRWGQTHPALVSSE